MSVVCAVEIPLQNFVAPKTGSDLGRQEAFADGAAQAGLLVPQQKFDSQRLGKSSVFIRPAETAEGIAGAGAKIRLGRATVASTSASGMWSGVLECRGM